MKIELKTEIVYYVPLSGMDFRRGIPGEIIGIKMLTPDYHESKLCYHVKWSDDMEDFYPIGKDEYKIITFTDILEGKVPKIEQNG